MSQPITKKCLSVIGGSSVGISRYLRVQHSLVVVLFFASLVILWAATEVGNIWLTVVHKLIGSENSSIDSGIEVMIILINSGSLGPHVDARMASPAMVKPFPVREAGVVRGDGDRTE